MAQHKGQTSYVPILSLYSQTGKQKLSEIGGGGKIL